MSASQILLGAVVTLAASMGFDLVQQCYIDAPIVNATPQADSYSRSQGLTSIDPLVSRG